VNRCGEDLRGLRLEVEEDNLPHWVSFKGLGEVSVCKGARVPLRILIELKGAPLGEEFTFPCAKAFYFGDHLEGGFCLELCRRCVWELIDGGRSNSPWEEGYDRYCRGALSQQVY